MSRRRRIALAVTALAAVALLATGAFGFTNVSAERGVSVAVVDDESAFLGLPNDPAVTCEVADDTETGCTVALVDVTNQFSTALTDVSATADGGLSLSTPDDIGVGEAGTISGTVACDPDEDEETTRTYDLAISVDGDGVSATKYDKEVTVSCIGVEDPLDSVSVTFSGCGNAEITGDAEDFPLDATLTFTDGTTETVTVGSSGEMVRGSAPDGTQLESVEIGPRTFENGACTANGGRGGSGSDGSETTDTAEATDEPEGTDEPTETDEPTDTDDD